MGRYDIILGKKGSSKRKHFDDEKDTEFYKDSIFEIYFKKQPYYCQLLKMTELHRLENSEQAIELAVTKLIDTYCRPVALNGSVGNEVSFTLMSGPRITLKIYMYNIDMNADERLNVHRFQGEVVHDINKKIEPSPILENYLKPISVNDDPPDRILKFDNLFI